MVRMMYGFGWGPGFGWIFMILFWVLIILGIVALGRWLFYNRDAGGPTRGPLDILKERYARGEIESEEFEKKSRDLDR